MQLTFKYRPNDIHCTLHPHSAKHQQRTRILLLVCRLAAKV